MSFMTSWKTESEEPFQLGILSSGSPNANCGNGASIDGSLQTTRAIPREARLGFLLQTNKRYALNTGQEISIKKVCRIEKGKKKKNCNSEPHGHANVH